TRRLQGHETPRRRGTCGFYLVPQPRKCRLKTERGNWSTCASVCMQTRQAYAGAARGFTSDCGRRLRQAGGGPKTSTALRPPKAKEFDIAYVRLRAGAAFVTAER